MRVINLPMISPATLAAFSAAPSGVAGVRAPVGGVSAVQSARAQGTAPSLQGGASQGGLTRTPPSGTAPNPSLPRGSLLNLTV
jgi:hypothetical protein